MKTCIFLIILLGFIEVVFCGNLTELIEDEFNHQCPVSWLRPKRQLREYTRWRANIETTAQFIVKVLDEETVTAKTLNQNQIVAVNILPVTKREKIIVGGAMVPPPPAALESPDMRDYTRFMPPSASLSHDNLPVAERPVPHLQPVMEADIPPIKPPSVTDRKKGSYVKPKLPNQRDESPPAGPQFIAHYGRPTALARQYAPIAPVAFTRRITAAPVTPPTLNYNPTRSTFAEYSPPLRSTLTAPPTFPSIVYDDDRIPTHSSYQDEEVSTYGWTLPPTYQKTPYRTSSPKLSTGENLIDEKLSNYFKSRLAESAPQELDKEIPVEIFDKLKTDDDRLEKFSVPDEDHRKDFFHHEITTGSDRDLDNYIRLFYEDDDTTKDETTRKEPELQRFTEDYDDKVKFREGHALTSAPESTPTQIQDVPEKTSKKYVEYTDDPDAETELSSTKRPDSEIPTATKKKVDIESLAVNQSKVVTFSRKMFNATFKHVEESTDRKPQICSLLKLRQLNFNSPRTLPEIVSQLKQWAEDSPVAKWVDITDGNFTAMENPIYMMIVDDPSSGQIVTAKQIVMIVAGIQGRDHHAVAAAMYMLYQLVERSEAHADVLSRYRFWIIPVFNPDGYDYSMTYPHRREWSKNLRQTWDTCKGRESCRQCESHGLRCTIEPCYGVNLDRNFEYQWIPTDELKAEHPCGPLYAGERQLSEPETRALTRFMRNQHVQVYTFIAFKEGEILGVMYPYSHTRKRRAFDYIFRQKASQAAAAAYSISGRPFVAGQTSEFLSLYAGGIEDWVESHLGIDNTFTIMMFRPHDTGSTLITERVVHETYAATDTLLMQTTEVRTNPPKLMLAARSKTTRLLSTSMSLRVLSFVLVLNYS